MKCATFIQFCRASGCARVLEPGTLFCQYHWTMIPDPLRKQIDLSSLATLGARGLRSASDHLRKYLEAVKEAVAAIAAAERGT